MYFQQGIARFLLGGSRVVLTLLSVMGHSSSTKNVGLQITVVFKMTKDGDACTSQCGKKENATCTVIRAESTPSPGTISYLSFNMSLTSLDLSSVIHNMGQGPLSTSQSNILKNFLTHLKNFVSSKNRVDPTIM